MFEKSVVLENTKSDLSQSDVPNELLLLLLILLLLLLLLLLLHNVVRRFMCSRYWVMVDDSYSLRYRAVDSVPAAA